MKKVKKSTHTLRFECIVKALKLTTCYELKQIEIVETDHSIDVYSIEKYTGERSITFHSTHLIPMIEVIGLSCYVTVDIKGFCYLCII